MARPRTVKPRSLRHAALGLAIESVIAENPDLTPSIVADDADLNEKQLGTLMRGQTNPRYSTLLKLCDGLRVSLAELMLREEKLYKEALRERLDEPRRGIEGELIPEGRSSGGPDQGARRDWERREASQLPTDLLVVLFDRPARGRRDERDRGERL